MNKLTKVSGAAFLLILSISTCRCWPISSSSVHKFRGAIRSIRDDVLGVLSFQKHVNNIVKLERISLDGARFSSEIARSLSLKFKDRVDAVSGLSRSVADSFSPPSTFGVWEQCCSLSKKLDINDYDARFHALIDPTNACNVIAPTASFEHRTPALDFMKVAIKNLQAHPGLKWQYFGSDKGVFTRYPAAPVTKCNTTYDNRFRPWYVQASAPKPKDVVVVIDRSGSMADYGKMEAAKEAAITVLSTLTPNDRVSVVTFSKEAYALGSKRSEDAVSTTYFIDGTYTESKQTACFDTEMAAATPRNIERLVKIVKTIVPFEETYYAKALTLAFKFLRGAYGQDLRNHAGRSDQKIETVINARDRVILFLSDGAPTDAPTRIFKLIQESNRALRNSVVLMCYALGDGTFGSVLKTMALQKFRNDSADAMHRDCADHCVIPSPIEGHYKHVVDTMHLRSEMGSYYSFFSTHKATDKIHETGSDVVWSVPYFDAGGLGMVLTAASSVVVDDQLVGVVGADLTMHELFADITYFRIAGHTAYVFLVDLTGRVLSHPYLPAPVAIDDNPVITNIDAFERSPDVRRFIKRTLTSIASKMDPSGGSDGVYTGVFHTLRVLPAEHQGVNTYNASSSYSCSSIRWTPFVSCVVVNIDIPYVTSLAPYSGPSIPGLEFVYHRSIWFRKSVLFHQGAAPGCTQRLQWCTAGRVYHIRHEDVSNVWETRFDLVKPDGMCRHQTQAAVEDRSAVMFSPSAFVDSGRYSELPETAEMVRKYASYMLHGNKSSSHLFNPDVRSSFLITSALDQLWRSLRGNVTSSSAGNFSNHVIWRYLGTEQGVFRIFPGAEMPKLYNPVHRPWYELGAALSADPYLAGLQKNDNGDEILAAVSPPYIDANGAGLVITVSRAITEPPQKDSSSSSSNNTESPPTRIFGVMGADIFLSFFEKVLKTTVEECSDPMSTCIVLDTSGFVIYDRSLANQDGSTQKLASESMYHVVHAHPSVARTLIHHGVLVGRRCVDVASVAYKFDYKVDRLRLQERTPFLPFAIIYLAGSNVVLLSVPLKFHTVHGCESHNQPEATCQNPSTSQAVCESPCLDSTGASKHFETCQNLYSYSEPNSPPPCLPVQYADDPEKAVNLELGIMIDPRAFASTSKSVDPSSLPPCHGEVALGDELRKARVSTSSENQSEARNKFIMYVMCVGLLLVAIQCGLKRKRIATFIRSRYGGNSGDEIQSASGS